MGSVSIKDVIRAYGQNQVMHGVDVEIEDGEFIILVGPSDCGKSKLYGGWPDWKPSPVARSR